MTRVLVIAIAASLGAACGHSRLDETPLSSNDIPRPFDYIPARWVDLPEAPFVAQMRGDRALLIARTRQSFRGVTAGCVVPVDGKTTVIANLIETLTTHGSFGRDRAVADLLASLNNPEVYAALSNAIHCPADSYLAVTAAGGDTGKRWSAEGTRWPEAR